MTILKMLIYFLVGATEWSLATIRTWHISKGNAGTVAIIVLIEESLLAGITAYIVNNPKEWYLLFVGVLGGSLGSFVSLKLFKRRQK